MKSFIAWLRRLFRLERPVAAREAPRPTLSRDAIPLYDRLEAGDEIAIRDRRKRADGPYNVRYTTFLRFDRGRMVLRTGAWSRAYRRPVEDLLYLIRGAA